MWSKWHLQRPGCVHYRYDIPHPKTRLPQSASPLSPPLGQQKNRRKPPPTCGRQCTATGGRSFGPISRQTAHHPNGRRLFACAAGPSLQWVWDGVSGTYAAEIIVGTNSMLKWHAGIKEGQREQNKGSPTYLKIENKCGNAKRNTPSLTSPPFRFLSHFVWRLMLVRLQSRQVSWILVHSCCSSTREVPSFAF